MRLFTIAIPLIAGSIMAAGCNAVLGVQALTYSPEDGGPDTSSQSPPDAGPDSGEDSAAPDGDAAIGSDAEDADVPDTNVPDANMPDTYTPPPPAAKPGFDLTAGGTYSKTAKYLLIGAVGESPGGNNIGKSPKYVLKAGVIAVTQRN